MTKTETLIKLQLFDVLSTKPQNVIGRRRTIYFRVNMSLKRPTQAQSVLIIS